MKTTELKATTEEWIICASRLARALRTTPFMVCGELNHGKGEYHAYNEECPVCKENVAALLEIERLNKLPVDFSA